MSKEPKLTVQQIQDAHEMARGLVREVNDRPELGLAIIVASSSLQAAAAAQDPENPSRSLKASQKYYSELMREAFQVFVRKARRNSGSGYDA